MTDIEVNEQVLSTGGSNTPVDSDSSLMAALRITGGGVYGNYPIISVAKRVKGTRGAEEAEISARSALATGVQGGGGTPDWESCCSRT